MEDLSSLTTEQLLSRGRQLLKEQRFYARDDVFFRPEDKAWHQIQVDTLKNELRLRIGKTGVWVSADIDWDDPVGCCS